MKTADFFFRKKSKCSLQGGHKSITLPEYFELYSGKTGYSIESSKKYKLEKSKVQLSSDNVSRPKSVENQHLILHAFSVIAGIY